MFKNVWLKIQILAVIIFILCMTIGIVLSAVSISNDNMALLLSSVLIFLSGMILSWFIYGFGQLIENTEKNANINEQILQHLQSSNTESKENRNEVSL